MDEKPYKSAYVDGPAELCSWCLLVGLALAPMPIL
jgi:hypothetical protein